MKKNLSDFLEDHGTGSQCKIHGFHGDISMLSMLAWDRKTVRLFPA